MSEYFYYITCPLCQQDVEPTQPDFYRVLPLNCERMAAFNKKPVCDEYENLTVGDLKVSWGRDVPFIPYMGMAWLLHTRCISFVDHLSLPKLYLLVDLVSSNVMSNAQLNPPRSQYGAFYAESIQEENSMPEPPVSSVKQLAQGFWGVACALLCCIASEKDRTDNPSSLSLPTDIWKLVLQYDIGRLLFILKTASQLPGLGIQHRIPNTRFSVEILDLPSSVVQIHLISIGGRKYISHLSSSIGNHGTQAKDTRCCDISGSNYIAIKNDGIGIVDIAFGAQDSQPDWVLHNPTEPFGTELCQIRDANLQSLHIFRDALKCRAIVPFSRGPEAYIQGPPFPPHNCWVTPGFVAQSKLSEVKGPFTRFIPAFYIPFADMKRITFDFYPEGIEEVFVNERTQYEKYSVVFDEPPKVVKFLVCQISQDTNFPFIQFNINNQWLPRLPGFCTILRENVFENAVGFWFGKTFTFIPAYIGMVVSQPTGAMEYFL